MPALVRSITFVGLVIALAGCGRAHRPPAADGAVDASRHDDGGHVDGGDAEVVLPPCDRPLGEWAPSDIAFEGSWSRMHGTRNGPETVLAVGTDTIEVLRFEVDGPVPTLRSRVALADTAGTRPFGIAADDFRIVTTSDADVMQVHDVGGGLHAEWPLDEPPGSVSFALSGLRIGLLVEHPEAGEVIASVLDVGGGPPVVSETLPGLGDAGIGIGRGLFSFLATPTGGTTAHLFGLDELGTIDALDLEVPFGAPRADGAVFLGWTASGGGSLVRHPGGRIEVRGAVYEIMATGPAVLADGPHGVLVVRPSVDVVYFSLVADAWAPAPSHFSHATSFGPIADHGPARVGAFYLEGDTLRWTGLSCAP